MVNNVQYFFAFIGILLIFIAAYKAFQWNKSFRNCRAAKNKFRLYKVRDDFIFLAASNQINENSWIFENFYFSINRMVKHQHKFNFYNLLRTMRDETAQARSEEFLEKLTTEIKKSNPEVRDAIMEFYGAIANIVFDNSLFLRIILKTGRYPAKIWKFIERYAKKFKMLNRPHYSYETYNSSKYILSIIT